MTAFVLVSGPFTGGWIWAEVVVRLRAAGAQAYAVTPAAMGGEGDRTRAADVDLETHIDDVLRVVDRVPTGADVVLVGHDYGIHPVLGAADRRPERIARVVYLDAGMPGDGDTALAALPDGPGLLARAGATGLVPPPRGERWRDWGSTAGLSEAHLDRLDRLAAPQPVRTLTQPLRLTGSPFDRPTTGVLCTANGSGIGMVEAMVANGPARLRVLTGPHVRFFELGTGHWPMLSEPGPLAGILLRAAAGEGRRLDLPEAGPGAPHGAGAYDPAHPVDFPVDAPECPHERQGRLDLHLPRAEGPRPAVLFVHGGPVSPDQRPRPGRTPVLLGYGRYAASLGLVGASVDHRLYDLTDYPRAARDVAEAVDALRADPRVDGDRIALWFFSGGGLLAADWLSAEPRPWLRCVALTYPVLAPPPSWRAVDARFRPVAAVTAAGAAAPPVVLTRVGREHAVFAATVEEFVTAAATARAEVEPVDVPGARHGFETLDPERADEAREAITRAAGAVVRRLTA
ncbi:alpha/beta fold hydrolase [Streptomyces sp. NPDC048717]|uniref:alpha/beta hydrolase n=1 Tax=Streptomyces sp. NPDC048717 TaxID=3154928 RepID=UPI003420473E